jgi:hexosaminidase
MRVENTISNLKSVIIILMTSMFIFTGCGSDYSNHSDNMECRLKAENQFKIRGFHIDMRIQVMTMDALKSLVDELSDFGINTLIVEWEATYPYRNHTIISNELSYTRDEIKDFIQYSRLKGINVIPLQQCFGHVEFILRNDRYSNLREDRKDISQLCPMKVMEDSLLFSDIFKDLAETHNSEFIHIGGDETYLLGHCEECARKVKEEGKSKLFVDYMRMMCNIVIASGKTPLMWDDILLKYPEAAKELPPQTIFIDWNYGWRTDLFGDVSKLQKEGFHFWGAPSIRSHPDNYYVTCWEKHFNNQRDFIPYARKAGYDGIIMTSWSTSGLYGFTWDVNYKVVDMEQIRNTYPLSGFRILLASYAEALNSDKPIDPHEFVVRYAKDRFGLLPNDGERLWHVLTLPPELIINGKPEHSASITEMKDSITNAIIIMNSLKPSSNLKEFEHLMLMLDIRKQYLRFKEIEAECNSPEFNISSKIKETKKLEKLIARSKQIDKRFYRLNRNFIYNSEIKKQNAIRNQELVLLYQRLKGMRNN